MWKGRRGSSGHSERNRLDSVRFLFVSGLLLRMGPCVLHVQASAPSLSYSSSPLLLPCTRVTNSGFDFVSVDYDLVLTTIPGPVPQSQMQTLTSDRALSV